MPRGLAGKPSWLGARNTAWRRSWGWRATPGGCNGSTRRRARPAHVTRPRGRAARRFRAFRYRTRKTRGRARRVGGQGGLGGQGGHPTGRGHQTHHGLSATNCRGHPTGRGHQPAQPSRRPAFVCGSLVRPRHNGEPDQGTGPGPGRRPPQPRQQVGHPTAAVLGLVRLCVDAWPAAAGSAGTAWARAQGPTIRMQWRKLAARGRITARKVGRSFFESCPRAEAFGKILERLYTPPPWQASGESPFGHLICPGRSLADGVLRPASALCLRNSAKTTVSTLAIIHTEPQSRPTHPPPPPARISKLSLSMQSVKYAG